jgi:hypothetical protein
LAILISASVAAVQKIEDLEVTVLPEPAFPKAASALKTGPYELVVVSSDPNRITDEDAWFEKNNLELPEFEVPNAFQGTSGNLPDRIPRTYQGNPLIRAIYGGDSTLFLYGRDFASVRYLIAMDPKTGDFRYGFDFFHYLQAPGAKPDTVESLTWAEEEEGVLYVANGHSTYAADSKGLNAYLTAIDPKAGKVLWRSSSLVSNARDFAILEDMIVSGYGFTKEPDFLYLIDKKTGQVMARTKVKSGPDYIVPKEGKVYVRCYDVDYVVEIRRR